MKVSFSKYQGTGNDFIMIDNRTRHFVPDEKAVARLCSRRTGIGADGLILIEPDESTDFSMRYFNADGKEATMCGNGGRCVIDFAHSLGISGNKTLFRATDGIHEGRIEQNLIRLKMQEVQDINTKNNSYILNTGSPHYVTFVQDVKAYPVVIKGREIRYSPDFQPEGINVNFVEILDNNTIFNRTYERGVEDETLSCGTGSVAAALVFSMLRQNGSHPVKVHTLGGVLKVSFKKVGNNKFTDIWLEGPAEKVFDGFIEI